MKPTVTTVSTFRSALGMVSQSFNTVTSTINMADNFVSKAAYKQEREYAIELDQFEQNLALEAARNSAESKLAANDFRSQSEEHAQYHDEALARVTEVLKNCKRPNPFARASS